MSALETSSGWGKQWYNYRARAIPHATGGRIWGEIGDLIYKIGGRRERNTEQSHLFIPLPVTNRVGQNRRVLAAKPPNVGLNMLTSLIKLQYVYWACSSFVGLFL
jgi:hypothetical protein